MLRIDDPSEVAHIFMAGQIDSTRKITKMENLGPD